MDKKTKKIIWIVVGSFVGMWVLVFLLELTSDITRRQVRAGLIETPWYMKPITI